MLAIFAKGRLRTHADRKDDDVRLQPLAGSREDFQRAIGRLLESGHAIVELEV